MNSKYNKTARTITETTEALKCPVVVLASRNAPQATLWHCKPIRSQYKSEIGTKSRSGKLTTLSQVRRAAPDLAMYLSVPSVRVRRGNGCIIIEVPKDDPEILYRHWIPNPPHPKIALGKDMDNETVTVDISKRPHILIGGSTGMGKSVMLHTILWGLLPISELYLIDPKHIEFEAYRGIRSCIVVTDKELAIRYLAKTRDRVDRRLKKMAQKHTRDWHDVEDYRLTVVIDELASLTLHSTRARDLLIEIAERGRAAGVHLVTATQTPKANVISTNFRNNCGIRIAFRVPDHTASGVILGQSGAQHLSNPGDGLLLYGGELMRFQAAMVEDLSYLDKFKPKSFIERILG